jgi:hypothetical protein
MMALFAAAMLALSGTSFAANMQGGYGNTGNKDNRPAVIQKGSHLRPKFPWTLI